MYKQLLTYLVKSLVNNPDEISINETEQEKVIVLELKVAQEDIGRVIGKEGRVIKSIRILMNSASAKMNKKIIVEVLG
jgi:hypothetical protein